MVKAVLVMDMPESCFGCNFCHINSNGGEDRCQALEVSRAVNSETYEKPDWCPLRELPEKKEEVELLECDPCCGSGSTLRAAAELDRSAYGFEIDRNFYERAKNEMLVFEKDSQMNISDFIGDTV